MAKPEKLARAVANAPVTSAQAQRGRVELARMRGALTQWLRYRRMLDAHTMACTAPPGATAQCGQPKPPVLLSPRQKKGLVRHTPASLARARAVHEQELATQLYQLLSEAIDPASLPDPDLTKNPQAAVELAEIAIAGKPPGRVQEQLGALWVWPVVIVVGVIGFVLMTAIRSSAEVAKEKERLECVKVGACTDTGFFLKLAAVAVIGWLAWDKLGLREKVKGAMAK